MMRTPFIFCSQGIHSSSTHRWNLRKSWTYHAWLIIYAVEWVLNKIFKFHEDYNFLMECLQKLNIGMSVYISIEKWNTRHYAVRSISL